jgi:hypothetical protein
MYLRRASAVCSILRHWINQCRGGIEVKARGAQVRGVADKQQHSGSTAEHALGQCSWGSSTAARLNPTDRRATASIGPLEHAVPVASSPTSSASASASSLLCTAQTLDRCQLVRAVCCMLYAVSVCCTRRWPTRVALRAAQLWAISCPCSGRSASTLQSAHPRALTGGCCACAEGPGGWVQRLQVQRVPGRTRTTNVRALIDSRHGTLEEVLLEGKEGCNEGFESLQ